MANTEAIGAELGTTTFPIERGKVREFAKAILDDNPVYEDENPPLPLTYTISGMAFWPRSSDKPAPDLGFKDMRRVLHGEQEYEYLRPIAPGDTLTGTTKISDVYEKEGKRGGTMSFVVFETRFSNQRGEEVIVSRQVIVETAKAAN